MASNHPTNRPDTYLVAIGISNLIGLIGTERSNQADACLAHMMILGQYILKILRLILGMTLIGIFIIARQCLSFTPRNSKCPIGKNAFGVD